MTHLETPQRPDGTWNRDREACRQLAEQALKALAQTDVPLPESDDFETWWEKAGQFCRAGGGDYEKTFAYRAWEAGVARERARCADICEQEFTDNGTAQKCAAAIRKGE